MDEWKFAMTTEKVNLGDLEIHPLNMQKRTL